MPTFRANKDRNGTITLSFERVYTILLFIVMSFLDNKQKVCLHKISYALFYYVLYHLVTRSFRFF